MLALLAVALAGVTEMPVASGDAEGRWTVEECAQAIRELIGEPDYAVRFVYEDTWGDGEVRLLWRLEGREAEDGRRDWFSVDPDRHVVCRAYLYSRQAGSYSIPGNESLSRAKTDPAAAERLARRIAHKHCPSLLDGPHLYTVRTSESPFTFRWRQIAQPWGVRLPRSVCVGIDAVNGRFYSWDLTLTEVSIDPTPHLTPEAVTTIIAKQGFGAQEQTDLWPAVYGEGARQKIAWYGEYEHEGGHYMVIVDDVTGRVVAAMPGG